MNTLQKALTDNGAVTYWNIAARTDLRTLKFGLARVNYSHHLPAPRTPKAILKDVLSQEYKGELCISPRRTFGTGG